MKNRKSFFGKFCLFAGILLLLVGCNILDTKVTKENYNKIGVGMTQQEVINILGETDSISETYDPGFGSMKLWHYQSGMKGIGIYFLNGRVESKDWVEL
ncbi:MAG: outer membrane protein assembly factor BamE [Campylobacteraceae bacterium]|jgi:outer membrane protein assembly factor BamE (lipoprotein component of BamABCDE complex)|nr:outer membrane protein assembly factor BamE [Campylobacteraceae bacterium]